MNSRMSDTPNTDAAIERLANRRDVVDFKDGEVQQTFMSPSELLALRRLEILNATKADRAANGSARSIR